VPLQPYTAVLSPIPNTRAGVSTDPNPARVIASWPDLPPHIKAAVLALVGTAG
jgi:hypothetical protein